MPTGKTKTKARHKSFDTVDIEDSEPLSFDLGGETFNCYAEVQGSVILELMRTSAMADEDSRGVVMAVSVLDFFELVMPPEEHERLTKLFKDPKRIVPMTTMSEIMSWLIEQYTDRPTQQP